MHFELPWCDPIFRGHEAINERQGSTASRVETGAGSGKGHVMQNVSIGEVRLAYEEVGEGAPLIQVHGAGFGHHNFAAVTPFLADHFRVLNVDLRGFGESDRPRQQYTFEGWADDVAAFMDALGIEWANVHGTSMGGPVAVNVAVRHPVSTASWSEVRDEPECGRRGRLGAAPPPARGCG
jgi:pimeloyl-ACP methyl ester carboxylesterase